MLKKTPYSYLSPIKSWNYWGVSVHPRGDWELFYAKTRKYSQDNVTKDPILKVAGRNLPPIKSWNNWDVGCLPLRWGLAEEGTKSKYIKYSIFSLEIVAESPILTVQWGLGRFGVMQIWSVSLFIWQGSWIIRVDRNQGLMVNRDVLHASSTELIIKVITLIGLMSNETLCSMCTHIEPTEPTGELSSYLIYIWFV